MQDTAHRLLIVDDEPAVRALFTHALKKAGYIVRAAGSGEEALNMVDSGLEVDLLMLDYRMAGMNGAETLKQLRSRGVAAPAVLVSAVISTDGTAEKLGFVAGLEKPCSARELCEMARTVLATRPSSSAVLS